MENEMITVLLIKPFEEPVVCTIKNDLKVLQEMVGGYIELLDIDEHVTSIFNEDGIREGLIPNRVIRDNIIFGTIILSRYDCESGELTSLTEEEQVKYISLFSKAENMAILQADLTINLL